MSITRTPIIDDDGSGTTGTVIDNAWKTEFYNQIDAALTGGGSSEVIIQTTAGVIPLTAGKSLHVIVMNNSAPVQITGTSGAGRTLGERLLFLQLSSNGSTLAHGAAGVQNFNNFIGSAPTPLAASGAAEYIISVQGWANWKLIHHDQGAPIAVPYTAGLYTAGAGGAWGVDAADVLLHSYVVRGTTMVAAINLANTTITGATNIVYAAFPFTILTSQSGVGTSSVAVGGWGVMMCTAANTSIGFNRTDFANLPASTNTAGFAHVGAWMIA